MESVEDVGRQVEFIVVIAVVGMVSMKLEVSKRKHGSCEYVEIGQWQGSLARLAIVVK